jgi:transposase-like protein
MIRLFTALCKTIFKDLSDKDVFQNETDDFRHYDKRCPSCGAVGKLSTYGSYSRDLIYYQNKKVIYLRVSPLRFKCESCDTSHSLLPDILIPYSPYSIRFIFTVLIAYYKRTTTVAAICEHFGIAISTLYAWKKRLLEHKELMLSAIANNKEPALAFLRGLFGFYGISDILADFFKKHAFSFLQNRPTPTTWSKPFRGT